GRETCRLRLRNELPRNSRRCWSLAVFPLPTSSRATLGTGFRPGSVPAVGFGGGRAGLLQGGGFAGGLKSKGQTRRYISVECVSTRPPPGAGHRHTRW